MWRVVFFYILLKQEILGFRVQTFVTSSLYEIQEAAFDTCAAVNLEVWYTENDVTDYFVNKRVSVVESFIGYVGREGLFTQNYVFGFGGLGTREDSASALGSFLPDGSFGKDELKRFFPANAAPDYGCNKTSAMWNKSECVQGRWCVALLLFNWHLPPKLRAGCCDDDIAIELFRPAEYAFFLAISRYPPACGTTFPSPHCSELLIPRQSWSRGSFVVTYNYPCDDPLAS